MGAVREFCSSDRQIGAFGDVRPFFEAAGWRFVENPDYPSAFKTVAMAAMYDLADIERAKIMWADVSSFDNQKATDFTFMNFEHETMHLAVGLPLVGIPFCYLDGLPDHQEFFGDLTFSAIDTIPGKHRKWDLHKEPTRQLSSARLDNVYTVFLARVNKDALRDELQRQDIDPDLRRTLQSAIPETSVLFAPNVENW